MPASANTQMENLALLRREHANHLLGREPFVPVVATAAIVASDDALMAPTRTPTATASPWRT
jgi:hypothetical protein